MKKTVISMVLCGILAFGATGCTESAPSSQPESSQVSVSIAEATPTPEPTPTAEPTPTPAPETLVMNTEFSLGDWAITVTGMEFMATIPNGDYMQFTPTEGNQYLVVHAKVTNNGKESDTFLPSFSINDDVTAKVMYGDGYEYSATNLLAYDMGLHDSSLNPLSSKEGVIAFDVPQAVVDSSDPLSIVFYLNTDSAEVKLR